MRRILLLFPLLSTLSALVPQATPSGKKALTFDALMQVRRVADPQVSPDGRWIAYTVTVADKEKNTLDSDIWIVPVDGGEARQLTRSPHRDMRARWSPDGRHIAFISTRDGTPQIYILPREGGEPRKLTSMGSGVDGLIFSPDGSRLLFASEVYPECDSDDPQKALDCNAAKIKAASESKVKAHIATRLLYRHWNFWKQGRRSHLFVVPLDGSLPPRDISPGDYDTPPFSLGGPDDYAFSPDGREICFASKRDAREELSTNVDLFTVDLVTAETKKITTSPAFDGSPAYSPDGKFIAYRAQFRPGYESDRFRLMLYERATGRHLNLTEEFDRWIDAFTWSPDSRKIFFIAEDHGRSAIFEISLDTQKVRKLTRDGSAGDLQVTPQGDLLVFTRSTMQRPSEVYTAATDGTKIVARTRHNDSLIESLEMNAAEDFYSEGAPTKSDNLRVHSWLLKPPHFNPSAKYPLLLLVHGGPQGAWTDSWGFRWNPQMYAAEGYVVLMPNPRGSTGYGQIFIDEINRDWGGRCFQDLMLAMDEAEKLPFIDKNRTAAAGASFGGFMVNWFQGNTDRFKALVSHAGQFDGTSSYYVTEELWFPEWEMGGPPYENPVLYDLFSPSRYVKNFKTPELVTHGELDYRVPIGEGLAMFTALQRRGIESKLLVFPDEGHWILKPQNSELFYRTVIDWLNRFLKR